MAPVLAFFSGPELIIVGIVALLLFGSRVPAVMRSLGQSVTSFKKGLEDDDEENNTGNLDQKKK